MITAIKNKTLSFGQIQTHDLRVKAFRILLAFFAVLFCAYLYVIGSITFNIIARNNINKEESVLTSHVGELELQYLTLSGNVTMDIARAHGFTEASDIHYVSRDSSVSRATNNAHEL